MLALKIGEKTSLLINNAFEIKFCVFQNLDFCGFFFFNFNYAFNNKLYVLDKLSDNFRALTRKKLKLMSVCAQSQI